MKNSASFNQIKSLVSNELEKSANVMASLSETVCEQNPLLGKDVQKYLPGNSKQIRSCLIFLFSKLLYGQVNDNIIKLAAAVEIIHNATLLHDDVIDEADFRRSERALHKKYGNKLAILTGDFLLALAIKLLNQINNPQVNENFANCLVQLCSGEITQYFSANTTTSIDKYLEKSKNKTASLFKAALKSLADINSPKDGAFLAEFADAFGTAFQIQNDIKNLNEHSNDLSNGIFTSCVIYAFGENKDLTLFTKEEILQKALSEKSIKLSKNLINSELKKAENAINHLSENKYSNAIRTLCKLISQ